MGSYCYTLAAAYFLEAATSKHVRIWWAHNDRRATVKVQMSSSADSNVDLNLDFD